MSSPFEKTKRILSETKIETIPVPKQIITIGSDVSPYEGFKKLLDNNILSAPVYDVNTQKYTGFLDLRDLVSFVVFIDDDQKSEYPTDLQTILKRGVKLFPVQVDGVTSTYLSRRNLFKPVQKSESLWKAIQVLATGVHRVPVIDDEGKVINIISQTTLITFLHEHMKEIGEEYTQTVTQLGVGTAPVISVLNTSPAIDVFRLMDNKKISGVAVVTEEGRLIGNTSGRDLKLFVRNPSIEMLNTTSIMSFLNIIRQESVDIRSPTISCSKKDPFRMLIGKLASTKVHRMFIADDKDGYVPERVVSITDVFRFIVSKA